MDFLVLILILVVILFLIVILLLIVISHVLSAASRSITLLRRRTAATAGPKSRDFLDMRKRSGSIPLGKKQSKLQDRGLTQPGTGCALLSGAVRRPTTPVTLASTIDQDCGGFFVGYGRSLGP